MLIVLLNRKSLPWRRPGTRIAVFPKTCTLIDSGATCCSWELDFFTLARNSPALKSGLACLSAGHEPIISLGLVSALPALADWPCHCRGNSSGGALFWCETLVLLFPDWNPKTEIYWGTSRPRSVLQISLGRSKTAYTTSRLTDASKSLNLCPFLKGFGQPPAT
jgi:hypothetical protein